MKASEGHRNSEQQRAADAFSRIDAMKGKSPGFKNRYRSYVDRLGPTIIMNGLGQALATERAAAGPEPEGEDKKAHAALYRNLHEWLCRAEGGVFPSARDLLTAITQSDEIHYLQAQAEALAWLEWHKKCCRACFPKGEDDDT